MVKWIRAALAVSLLVAVGCDSSKSVKPTTEAPKETGAAEAADKTAKMAEKAPAKEAAPAAGGDSKQAEPAAKAEAVPVGDKKPAGELKPGQNSPTFLEGIDGNGPLVATIKTTMGELKCELYQEKTPQTVLNFVGLARGLKAFKDPASGQWVKRPFYDGIEFHRVIPKFMAQVGDPTGSGRYNPGYRFADEIRGDLKHTRGAILSMANAGPGTNGSQLFLTEVATPHLDGRHTVFGMCRDSDIAIVKKITGVPTGPGNKPLQPLKIEKITFSRGI
jgi:peptidyl-prolyl cis-trans isomerase A (cyclophilin A)